LVVAVQTNAPIAVAVIAIVAVKIATVLLAAKPHVVTSAFVAKIVSKLYH